MKPYYQDDVSTIYHADSSQWLADVHECFSVDLVLTDPPYGVGESYASFADTADNVRSIVSRVVPVARNHCRRMLLTCGTRQIHFYPPPDWILCWLNRAGSGINPWGFTCWQPILAYGSDPYLENSMGLRPDIIEHSETSEKNGHPCPKPIGFWKRLLARGSVKDTDIVLDPFMGSGTTLRAAKDLGRSAIGIEIEEKYCEIAAKRLSQEVFQF
jgi:site-specific DNA-methyltransferase (adenine-specific)